MLTALEGVVQAQLLQPLRDSLASTKKVSAMLWAASESE